MLFLFESVLLALFKRRFPWPVACLFTTRIVFNDIVRNNKVLQIFSIIVVVVIIVIITAVARIRIACRSLIFVVIILINWLNSFLALTIHPLERQEVGQFEGIDFTAAVWTCQICATFVSIVQSLIRPSSKAVFTDGMSTRIEDGRVQHCIHANWAFKGVDLLQSFNHIGGKFPSVSNQVNVRGATCVDCEVLNEVRMAARLSQT